MVILRHFRICEVSQVYLQSKAPLVSHALDECVSLDDIPVLVAGFICKFRTDVFHVKQVREVSRARRHRLQALRKVGWARRMFLIWETLFAKRRVVNAFVSSPLELLRVVALGKTFVSRETFEKKVCYKIKPRRAGFLWGKITFFTKQTAHHHRR